MNRDEVMAKWGTLLPEERDMWAHRVVMGGDNDTAPAYTTSGWEAIFNKMLSDGYEPVIESFPRSTTAIAYAGDYKTDRMPVNKAVCLLALIIYEEKLLLGEEKRAETEVPAQLSAQQGDQDYVVPGEPYTPRQLDQPAE